MCERIDLGDGNFAIVCGGRRAHRKTSMKPAESKTVKLPATLEQLRAAGWKPAYSRDCKLCHMPLEFWHTAAAKQMPLERISVDGKWLLGSHWATCVFADKFRKDKPKAVPAVEQESLFK